MRNLTLSIQEEVLRRARQRALQEGTSVNALVRAYLAAYSGLRSEREQAMARFLELGREAGGGSGRRSRTRDELYEERPGTVVERHQAKPGR